MTELVGREDIPVTFVKAWVPMPEGGRERQDTFLFPDQVLLVCGGPSRVWGMMAMDDPILSYEEVAKLFAPAELHDAALSNATSERILREKVPAFMHSVHARINSGEITVMKERRVVYAH